LHPGWIQDAVTELQIEPSIHSEQSIDTIGGIQSWMNNARMRFVFIAYSMAIGERGRTHNIVLGRQRWTKTYPRRPLPPNKRAATIKPTLTGRIQN